MRGVLKNAALSVATAAMLARALLPAGWMPNLHADASPIMLCPGMEMPAAPSKSDSHHAKSTFCACAAVAQLVTPAPESAGPAPAQSCSKIAFAATRDAPSIASLYRANAARAPPDFA